MLYYLHTCSVEGSALLCIHCFTSCFPSKNNCTRALSSTKPSVRCMALATCFNSSMQKRAGVAKGLGPGRDRDEANVSILAQQCYSRQDDSTAHSSNNPSVLYRTPHALCLWCRRQLNLPHCSLTSNSWGLS